MEDKKILHLVTGMEPGAALGRKVNANFSALLVMIEQLQADMATLQSGVKADTKKNKPKAEDTSAEE